MDQIPTYKEHLRKLHPEDYSDTVKSGNVILNVELLEFKLSTIAEDNKEHEFEAFCREMARIKISPNFIIQTGPTGGGDSKVDSETYPVDTAIAEAWPFVEASTSSRERWALAISARHEWRSKVQSDVRKIKSVEEAKHRGYTRVYFLSNQAISDKKRAEVEDGLREETSLDVRILDKKWLTDAALSTQEARRKTVETLGLSQGFLEEDRLGPNDAKKTVRLQEVESALADAGGASPIERVNLADEAAELICELERPDDVILGALERHYRMAKKHGTFIQKAEAIYQYAYRIIAYCEQPDANEFMKHFNEFEQLTLQDRSKNNIEHLITLWTVAVCVADQIGLQGDGSHLKILNGIVDDLGNDPERRRTYLEVSIRYLPVRLMAGDDPSDVIKRANDVLDEADGMLGFDFQMLVEMLRYPDLFKDCEGYNALLERVYEKVKDEENADAIVPALVSRASSYIKDRMYYDAIKQLSHALTCLKSSKDLQWHSEVANFLADVCFDTGLRNAARNIYHLVMNMDIDLFFGEGVLSDSLMHATCMLRNCELLAGNVGNALKLDSMMLLLKPLYPDEGSTDDGAKSFDGSLAMVLPLLPENELCNAGGLVEYLSNKGYGLAASYARFALGYYDAKDIDEAGGSTKDVDDFVLHMFDDLDARPSFPPDVTLGAASYFVLDSKIMGCQVRCRSSLGWEAYETACTVLGVLEGFFATSSLHKLIAGRESLDITISKDSSSAEPFSISSDYSGLAVTVGDLSGFSPSKRFDSLHGMLYRLVGEFARIAFPFPGALERIELLVKEDYAFDRAFLFGDSISVGGSSIDDLSCGFIADEHYSGDFPYVRDEPFSTRLREHLKKLGNPCPVAPYNIAYAAPADGFGLASLKQSNIRHESVVDVGLWNAAHWQGVGYATFPGQEPYLVLVFGDESGLSIFDEWASHGDRDVDRLKVSLVKNISSSNPLAYRCVVGCDFPRVVSADSDHATIVSTLVRFLDMEPENHRSLDAFTDAVLRSGACKLMPAIRRDDGSPDYWPEKAIALRPGAVRVMNAGEIGRLDLFECSALFGIEDPIVNDGEPAEIIQIIEERNSAHR